MINFAYEKLILTVLSTARKEYGDNVIARHSKLKALFEQLPYASNIWNVFIENNPNLVTFEDIPNRYTQAYQHFKAEPHDYYNVNRATAMRRVRRHHAWLLSQQEQYSLFEDSYINLTNYYEVRPKILTYKDLYLLNKRAYQANK